MCSHGGLFQPVHMFQRRQLDMPPCCSPRTRYCPRGKEGHRWRGRGRHRCGHVTAFPHRTSQCTSPKPSTHPMRHQLKWHWNDFLWNLNIPRSTIYIADIDRIKSQCWTHWLISVEGVAMSQSETTSRSGSRYLHVAQLYHLYDWIWHCYLIIVLVPQY